MENGEFRVNMDQNNDVEAAENGADVRLGGCHEMLAKALVPDKGQVRFCYLLIIQALTYLA